MKQKRKWISHPLAVPLLVGGFSLTSHADVIVTFTEDASGVTASYEGSVGFSPTFSTVGSVSQVAPFLDFGGGITGASFFNLNGYGFDNSGAGAVFDTASGFFPSFGLIGESFYSSLDGDSFGFDAIIFVPQSYVGGDQISGSAFYALQSFESMGLVDGSSFSATTVDGDTVTVVVGEAVSPIPEVTGSSVLLGLLGLTLFGRRRQR